MTRKRIILILASVLVLSLGWRLVASRTIIPSTAACINNLRQIDGAKQQWALEHGKTAKDTPAWQDIQAYLGRGPQGSTNDIHCPRGGVYTIEPVGKNPRCSLGGRIVHHTLDFDEDNRSPEVARAKREILCDLIGRSLAMVSAIGLVVVILLPRRIGMQQQSDESRADR